MNGRIIVDHISKSFGDAQVVKNVNLTMDDGKIYGLVGRNGSGKTVLMKIICGFLLPTTGTVTVSEKKIGVDVDFAPNTGVIIETPAFLNYLSGMDNLINLARIKKKLGRKEIEEVMILVGLDPASKKHVGKYSLGMKQRLGIAQAIMEDPDILILDEPMNGLDEDGIALVRDILLERKKQGKCIILASHNREDIEILCDEVYQMVKGELIIKTGNEAQGR